MLLVKWSTVVILIRSRVGGDVVIEVVSTCLPFVGMWRWALAEFWSSTLDFRGVGGLAK
jgi:hypothetical protein